MTRNELDTQSINQLHSVVLEMSKSCFELKKLCATVLGTSVTLIASFTRQSLDTSLFVGAMMVITFFWIADAQSYYYQEKIRIYMLDLQKGIQLRSSDSSGLFDGVGMPITAERLTRPRWRRVLHAAFNWSMTFYGGLTALVIFVYLLYRFQILVSKP
jgi:hypothetical protein